MKRLLDQIEEADQLNWEEGQERAQALLGYDSLAGTTWSFSRLL